MASIVEVTQIVTVLAAAYPGMKPLSEANFLAYHRLLKDLPANVLQAAADELGGSGTFFPTAGELRKAAFKLKERAAGVPSAQDAWAEVCKSFSTNGSYRGAPDWSYPVIGKAVEAVGGYAALCTSQNDVADRARFLQAYDAYLERHREAMRMTPEVLQVVAELGDGRRPLLTGGR